MIIIIAATADVTAREVCRWLTRWGHASVQIDCDDPVVDIDVELGRGGEDAVVCTRSGRVFRVSEVSACWYRRGALQLDDALMGLQLGSQPKAAAARRREWAALHDWLMDRLAARPALGSWQRERACTKLVQLSTARALGLAIPETRISSSRARLIAQAERWGAAVHKGMQAGAPAEEDPPADAIRLAGTTRTLRPERLEAAPERLFPRLIQARLDKQLELRIFHLAGRYWPMALVPRAPGDAPTDARVGDIDACFHLVPYSLPTTVEQQLRALNQVLQLDTGSIDMIVGPDGTHTFLEVNPSGQLDWLTRACDPSIERVIAEHLVALAGYPNPNPRGLESCGARTPARARDLDSSFDPSFAETPHRFARVHGQRVLVRGLGKPIFRRFVSAASAPKPGGPAPATTTRHQPRSPDDELSATLPASLRLVQGRERALLYDLQRGQALAAPADQDEALAAADRAGLLAWVREPDRFPAKPMTWEHPAAITNAVIDVDAGSTHDYLAIVAELAELGCEHVLMRVDRERGVELVDQIQQAVDDGPPMFFEWWLRSDASLTRAGLRARAQRWARIIAIIVFGAEHAEQWLETRSGIGSVLCVSEPLRLTDAPMPDVASMFVSDAMFRESLHHNPFFHRKLGIDARGQLRNAAHLPRSFGQFGERPLREVIESPAFTELGAIHKGMIDGCRECELRHACLDARAPVAKPGGGYQHTSICRYEPPLG